MDFLTTLIHFADFPLYAMFVTAVGIAIAGIFVGRKLGPKPVVRPDIVVGDLDAITERLFEAEKIGHFGSFRYDYAAPSKSFWSDGMFILLERDVQHTPLSVEVFLEHIHPEDRARIAAEWKQLERRSGQFSFSCRARSLRGRILHIRVQGTVTLDTHLRLSLIAGIAHDITKEMEVDRAKSEFASLASHQLKTPLTSIKWLSEALTRGSVGSLSLEQTQYVSRIHETSQRMMDMVNDLLNVSRVEAGVLSIKAEHVNIRDFVTNVIDEQRHVADTRRLTLLLEIEEGVPEISADKNLLRMVLQNLISNAIKYTSEGGKVTCHITRAEAVREMIFISVTDTGIGIPIADRSRIFEKLHRASNAEALVPDGTGLGLYLVKAIMERVGGAITFDSTENVGSTFYVSLPVNWQSTAETLPK